MQYLYNISKKCYLWSSFFTCRLTSKFLQVGIIVFDGNNQMISKHPQNRKLVTFLEYLQKKRLFNFFSGEQKFVLKRSLVINFFKADTILLGGVGVNKDLPQSFLIKIWSKKIYACNILVLQLLLCSIMMQNIQIFYRVLVISIVTCFKQN